MKRVPFFCNFVQNNVRLFLGMWSVLTFFEVKNEPRCFQGDFTESERPVQVPLRGAHGPAHPRRGGHRLPRVLPELPLHRRGRPAHSQEDPGPVTKRSVKKRAHTRSDSKKRCQNEKLTF